MTKNKYILSIFVTLLTANSFAQFSWGLNLDGPFYLDRICRDTISNPKCTWQIGRPNKTVFTSARSIPNAIVTDTSVPVPPNDTSRFYIKHHRDNSQPFHIFNLRCWFRMDGDSSDFGRIEVSPDNGNTWIDVLEQDSIYKINWNNTKPLLRGTDQGWQYLSLDMTPWASGKGTFPIDMTADTILFRFTYITDSLPGKHDGWMLDDFLLEDWFEGLTDLNHLDSLKVYPNPTSGLCYIHYEGSFGPATIEVFELTGRKVLTFPYFTGQCINTYNWQEGVYILQYTDARGSNFTKVIVDR